MELGGLNACLPAEQTPFVSQRPTIVFGADVTHPSPGNMNQASIAALAACMDMRATRYSSAIRMQAIKHGNYK
ncbi:hypothetical protein BDB00DRAFT_836225 [Zychaea mexicana]|uniref:uncharacterized protein n=1 Tax=Zychaea mexicana TaxID=64656 RepID=UPI0022FF2A29|nr:uncharacterized protein BDB00DRAFT_836225 [Zychaea mexicana]KAI9490815.1 hypothetical protein BDB00DRAFT_836225 [Zychaea mexicana]